MYRAELNYTLKDIRRFEKVHQMLRSKVLTIVMQVVLIAACLALAVATFMQFITASGRRRWSNTICSSSVPRSSGSC